MFDRYEYRDLARLTMVASAMIAIHLVLRGLTVGTTILLGASQPDTPSLVDLFTGIELLGLIATVSVVGRWIYCASRNAHSVSDAMAITPGWAVGWNFIPFANLYKPFQAMHEIWDVSQGQNGDFASKAPPNMRLWWGAWLIGNIMDNVATRLTAPSAASALNIVSVIGAGLALVAGLTLIGIMREISGAQAVTMQAHVFA